MRFLHHTDRIISSDRSNNTNRISFLVCTCLFATYGIEAVDADDMRTPTSHSLFFLPARLRFTHPRKSRVCRGCRNIVGLSYYGSPTVAIISDLHSHLLASSHRKTPKSISVLPISGTIRKCTFLTVCGFRRNFRPLFNLKLHFYYIDFQWNNLA